MLDIFPFFIFVVFYLYTYVHLCISMYLYRYLTWSMQGGVASKKAVTGGLVSGIEGEHFDAEELRKRVRKLVKVAFHYYIEVVF